MKMTSQKTVLATVAAMALCHLANAQPQTQSSPGTSGTSISKESGWSTYSSGGERGGVVQVISDADVQAELNLNNEQQQHVSDILRRVRGIEDEMFEELRRSRQADSDSIRTCRVERSKKYDEANQQLARATEKILALLTPAQRTQLQALCRQSKADEAAFQARMLPGQGGGGGGGFGGSGGGGGSGLSAGGRGGRPAGSGNVLSGAGGGGGGFGGGFGAGNSGVGRGTFTSNQYASGGGPGGVVRVISYERVQEQLGLGNQQRQQITEIISHVRQYEAAFFRSPNPVRGPEGFEQRKQKAENTRQAVASAGEEILRQLTPAQQQRLKEICLQAQGANALFKPEVIQALALTAAQQVKLANLRQEADRQMAALYSRSGKPGPTGSPIDLQSAAERAKAIQRDAETRMLTSVLTPTQRTKFKEMQGREFAGVARFNSTQVDGWAGADATTSSSE